MSFLPPGQRGWTLPYTSLTLHALTPATGDSPAHLYCQVDEDPGEGTSSGPTQGGAKVNGGGGAGMANGETPVPDLVDGDEGDDTDEGGAEGEGEYTPMRELRIYLPETKRESNHASLLLRLKP